MADLICPVAKWARQEPDLCAIADPSGNLTYADLDRRVHSAVRFFRGIGVRSGDHVAVQLAHPVTCVTILVALNRIGAIGILLSTRLPATSIATLITRFHCTYSISLDDLSVEGCRQVDLSNFSSLISGGSRENDRIDDSRPAVAVMTSGSSGEPKAALLTYRNLHYNALGSNQNIAMTPGDRWLLSLPLFHVGGLGIVHRCFIGGGTVVVAGPQTPLGTQIAEQRITHVSVVNTQLYRLVEGIGQGEKLSGLKSVLIGGSAVSPLLISRAVGLGLPVHTSYGLTEMGSQVTTTSVSDRPARLNTSGKLLPYGKIRLDGDEILVRGETRFEGYLTGDGISRPFDSDGWFATGDLGAIDDSRYLVVSGRKDNMFVSGGENIQPETVESALLGMTPVQDAVVVSVPDAEFGQRPVAFVSRYDDAPVDETRIKEQLREQLPGYMIPIRILPFPIDQTASSIKPGRKYLADLAGKLLKT